MMYFSNKVNNIYHNIYFGHPTQNALNEIDLYVFRSVKINNDIILDENQIYMLTTKEHIYNFAKYIYYQIFNPLYIEL